MSQNLKIYCNLPNVNYDHVTHYLKSAVQIAQHAEQFNYNGVLFHFNFQMLDPYILASCILGNTRKFSPIIASQPNYLTPLASAKMIQSLSYLYQRKVHLNLITGAAQYEMEQILETADHDSRYSRLNEYSELLRLLLSSNKPIDYNGKHYKYQKLLLKPSLPADLMPDFFLAGSSETAIQTALDRADVVITHPQPVDLFAKEFSDRFKHSQVQVGIKIGIITRKTEEEAWKYAQSLYEQTYLGKIKTMMKKKSESAWLRQLAELGEEAEVYDEVYWLGGFISGLVNTPILVGSYQKVSSYLTKYIASGVSVIMVSDSHSLEEFQHINHVIQDIKPTY